VADWSRATLIYPVVLYYEDAEEELDRELVAGPAGNCWMYGNHGDVSPLARSCRMTRAMRNSCAARPGLTPGAASHRQGLVLAHFSAQLERFVWDRGCA